LRESIAKRKPHPPTKETTRSITYRLPARIVEELETEAMQKNISQNVLVKQILEKFVGWDRFADKIGMIPIPKKILDTLGTEMKGRFFFRRMRLSLRYTFSQSNMGLHNLENKWDLCLFQVAFEKATTNVNIVYVF